MALQGPLSDVFDSGFLFACATKILSGEFERKKIFMQRQYDQAIFAVKSGFDPPFYDEDGWREGITGDRQSIYAPVQQTATAFLNGAQNAD